MRLDKKDYDVNETIRVALDAENTDTCVEAEIVQVYVSEILRKKVG